MNRGNLSITQRLMTPARIFILKSLLDKSISFKKLRKDLKMKDGSLWANLRTLENLGMIKMRKELYEDRRDAFTTYDITEKGRSSYLELKDKLLKLFNE